MANNYMDNTKVIIECKKCGKIFHSVWNMKFESVRIAGWKIKQSRICNSCGNEIMSEIINDLGAPI